MLGCGTVGTGVLRILRDTAELLETRLGRPLAVTAIAVRDSSAERDEVVPTDLLTTDPESIVSHPDVDVVLELMGGVERASELVLQALASGKQVVTANKAMLASDGERLFRQAESSGRDLLFEAAVGAGCR